jgi:5'(3')-deoxyribonucleotidase
MTKLTIAVDVDGVIQNCNKYVRETAERVLVRRMPEVADHGHFDFDKAMNLTQFEWIAVETEVKRSTPTLDMEWLPGAVEFVRDLFKAQHDVFFLTSHWRDCPRWVMDREARLQSKFGPVDVVFAHNKMRCSFDYLIDDKIQNIEKAGAAGLLFDQPWNRAAKHLDDRRFDSYNDLLSFLGVK